MVRSMPGDVSHWLPPLSCNRALNEHLAFAHCAESDVCLCGLVARPCGGACGLSDFSWLGVRLERVWPTAVSQ